jgi:D-Tyr-tRNAtyr deacylase
MESPDKASPTASDTETDTDYLAEKIAGLRIIEDLDTS